MPNITAAIPVLCILFSSKQYYSLTRIPREHKFPIVDKPYQSLLAD